VEAGKTLTDAWAPTSSGAYDLWVLAPNGFHRHFTGNARRVAAAGQPNPDVVLGYDPQSRQLRVQLSNTGPVAATFTIAANAYYPATPATVSVVARGTTVIELPLATSGGWYDFSVRVKGQSDYSRRFAGRLETGADSTSDPAMHGTAVGNQYRVS
jgi:phospholipase C